MTYILEVGKVKDGLTRHMRVTMPDGSSRRAQLLCLGVSTKKGPDIPGDKDGDRFPYEEFGPEWPMRYNFARKLPIINIDHVSEDDTLLVRRAIAPFQLVPVGSTAREKAVELYEDIRTFAEGLGTVMKAASVVEENYECPVDVEGPKDHMMRVALKMLFESRLYQRDMSKIVKLKGI